MFCMGGKMVNKVHVSVVGSTYGSSPCGTRKEERKVPG